MKTMFKKVLGGAMLATALLGGAQATPLSLLLSGGSITAGDKLFDHWSLTNFAASDGRLFDATNIEVSALNDGGLDPGTGLQFQVLNRALSITGNGSLAFANLIFGFRASVLTPGQAISGVSLFDIGAALGSTHDLNDGDNDNGSYIREALGTAPGLQDLGMNEVEFSILDSVHTFLPNATSNFSPAQGEVWVTKNIRVWAAEATDDADLFSFNQRFSQTTAPVPVPVPGSLALVALALAGLVVSRHQAH